MNNLQQTYYTMERHTVPILYLDPLCSTIRIGHIDQGCDSSSVQVYDSRQKICRPHSSNVVCEVNSTTIVDTVFHS